MHRSNGGRQNSQHLNPYEPYYYDTPGRDGRDFSGGNQDFLEEEDEHDTHSELQITSGATRRPYGSIGRGAPPSRPPRSLSMNPGYPNPQPSGRRSRSTNSTAHNGGDQAASPALSDLEEMFTRFSMQQDERHREQTRQFQEQNDALLQRLAALENKNPNPARGRSSTRRTTAQDATPVSTNTSTPNSTDDPSADDADDEAPNSRRRAGRVAQIEPTGLVKTAIQKFSTQMFRRVCNVNGKVWPDPNIERINPTTGEKYLTPVWQFDVTESRNKFVCETLATQVEAEMRLKRPEGVPDDAVWDSKFLLKCAKNSFRAMKDSWRDGVEAEAKARTEINQRNTRMFRRRDTKLEHIMSQIEEYAEVHNIPLAVAKDLLTQQHVSDEASGPEDEDEETPAAWKVRMAIECGIQDLSAANLKKLNFFEVLKCPWRSPQLSQISHVTQTMWAKSLTENELKNIKFRRVTTTHRKSLRIPKTSPWDFGINQEWLEEHGDLVSTWGTYGNPEGFEVPDSAEVGEVRARIDESADPRFAFEGGVNA